jgi:hypothetical protein
MKRVANILGIVQVFIAVGAIPAGLSMIINPDGSDIGLPIDLLSNSPFQNFLIPGLFLFIVNGLFTAIGAFLSFTRNKYAGISGMGLGFILMLWISIQVYFIGLTHLLQPTYFLIGLVEMILGYFLIPKTKSISKK